MNITIIVIMKKLFILLVILMAIDASARKKSKSNVKMKKSTSIPNNNVNQERSTNIDEKTNSSKIASTSRGETKSNEFKKQSRNIDTDKNKKSSLEKHSSQVEKNNTEEEKTANNVEINTSKSRLFSEYQNDNDKNLKQLANKSRVFITPTRNDDKNTDKLKTKAKNAPEMYDTMEKCALENIPKVDEKLSNTTNILKSVISTDKNKNVVGGRLDNEVRTWKNQCEKYFTDIKKMEKEASNFLARRKVKGERDKDTKISAGCDPSTSGAENLSDKLKAYESSLSPYEKYVRSSEVAWIDFLHAKTALEDYWLPPKDESAKERIDAATSKLNRIIEEYSLFRRNFSRESSKLKKLRERDHHICRKRNGKFKTAFDICRNLRKIYFWQGEEKVICVEVYVNNQVVWGQQWAALCKFSWPGKGTLTYFDDPFTGIPLDASKNKGPDVTLAILDGHLPNGYFLAAVHTETEPHRVTVVNYVNYDENSNDVILKFPSRLSNVENAMKESLKNSNVIAKIPKGFGQTEAMRKIKDWFVSGTSKGDWFDPKTGAFSDYFEQDEERVMKMFSVVGDKNKMNDCVDKRIKCALSKKFGPPEYHFILKPMESNTENTNRPSDNVPSSCQGFQNEIESAENRNSASGLTKADEEAKKIRENMETTLKNTKDHFPEERRLEFIRKVLSTDVDDGEKIVSNLDDINPYDARIQTLKTNSSSKLENNATSSNTIDISYPVRIKVFDEEYDYYLKRRVSATGEATRQRKNKICHDNGEVFAEKLCSEIRNWYGWDGRVKPKCAYAKINKNSQIERVALCKLEWPGALGNEKNKVQFASSPITGRILNTDPSLGIPAVNPHTLTIAMFDGLGEFECFIGKVDGRVSKNEYRVSVVNLVAFDGEVFSELWEHDLIKLMIRVFVNYSDMMEKIMIMTRKSLNQLTMEMIDCFMMDYHLLWVNECRKRDIRWKLNVKSEVAFRKIMKKARP